MIIKAFTTRVLAAGLDFPEGPLFDLSGNIWLVELKGGNLVEIRAGEVIRYPTGGSPNGGRHR
ncbi:MAG: hypothetical protein HC880_08535 [Bacteroidia bacterium]|nr:hypothetical protein [Bacteroidia bacterium]